jgi:hypothetical protein
MLAAARFPASQTHFRLGMASDCNAGAFVVLPACQADGMGILGCDPKPIVKRPITATTFSRNA